MIAEVDSPEGFVGSIKKMLTWLHIKENIYGSGERDIAVFESVVYERLNQLLDEFANFYASFRPMLRAEEFGRLLRLFLGGVFVPEVSLYGRGVLFFDVNYARYLKRDVVFLTGIDNDSFPSVYDEYTLHDLKIAEKIKEHKYHEEGLLFYMSITGAKRLYLTFPGIDDEGKDDSKSPYLKEIQECIASWSTPFVHHGNQPPPKPRVVIERKECLHLGGGFYAELTATEWNKWARHARGEGGAIWRDRERYCELLLRARAQGSADEVASAHKNFLNYDWLVYELAEAWYTELVKQREQAMEDKTDG